MDLSHPQHLWYLCALPVLWLLARPLRPRLSVTTPYLELWQRALARVRRRPIRVRWLRLLLLVLAFAAATLAFAGARLGHRDGPTRLVVLLDASGSMAARARPDGETSWQAARHALVTKLAGVPAEVPVAVGVAGRTLELKELDARRDLAWLPGEAGRGRGVDLAALADSAASEECAVWTLTDGLVPARVPALGAVSLVGAPGDNLAITGCAVSDAWPLPDLTVVLDVQNASALPARTTLTVTGGATLSAPHALELAPRASERVTLALRRGQGGAVTIGLAARDLLPRDDSVALSVPAPAAPDVVVLADVEDHFLIDKAATALVAEIGGRLVVAGQGTATRGSGASGGERAGLLLVEGGALPAGSQRARMITFGTRFAGGELAAGDLALRPRVVDWARASPLLAELDLSELFVGRSLARGFGEPGEGLIAGDAGPLAVVVRHAGGASVHFAFTLGESNLGFLAAFPSLLRRAFAACYGEAAVPRAPAAWELDAGESDLRARAEGAVERPLPSFGSAGASLVVPLLLLALFAMVLRIYC